MSTTTGWHGPTAERLALAATVRKLRDEQGLIWREIGEALGISRSYASDLYLDPDGARSRARKDSYAQPCVDCGASTSGSEGRKIAPRCHDCAAAKAGLARTYWTAALIIERIQEWVALYGAPPAIADWSPQHARQALGDEARAQRFESADGRWPWFTIVFDRFGSWNDALEAAGFAPRARNGGDGNELRRRSVRARAFADTLEQETAA